MSRLTSRESCLVSNAPTTRGRSGRNVPARSARCRLLPRPAPHQARVRGTRLHHMRLVSTTANTRPIYKIFAPEEIRGNCSYLYPGRGLLRIGQTDFGETIKERRPLLQRDFSVDLG